MPIDFNKTGISGEREGRSSGDGGDNGINFNRLGVGGGNPEGGKEGGGLFSRFRRGGEDPKDRAKQAAEEMKFRQQQQQEEQRKQTRLERARERIRRITEENEPQKLGVPGIDYGLVNTIGRIAVEQGPDVAYEYAVEKYQEAREHNDRIPRLEREQRHQLIRVLTKRQRLNKEPYRVTGKPINREEKVGLKRIALNTAEVVKQQIVARLNGTPEDAYNGMEVTGEGLVSLQPKERISRTRPLSSEQLKSNFYLAPDPPKYFDGIYGLVGRVVSIEFADRWLPWGRIGLTDARGNLVGGDVPTFFPGRVAKRIEEELDSIALPGNFVPDYIPEPTMDQLLNQASVSLGYEPGSQQPESETKKPPDSSAYFE